MQHNCCKCLEVDILLPNSFSTNSSSISYQPRHNFYKHTIPVVGKKSSQNQFSIWWRLKNVQLIQKRLILTSSNSFTARFILGLGWFEVVVRQKQFCHQTIRYPIKPSYLWPQIQNPLVRLRLSNWSWNNIVQLLWHFLSSGHVFQSWMQNPRGGGGV